MADKEKINFKVALELVGFSHIHFRKLVTTGQVPSAAKDEKGRWKFDQAAVEKWIKERKTFPRGDGSILYKVRLQPEQLALVENALKGTGIVFVRANKPAPRPVAAAPPQPVGPQPRR